MYGDFLMTHHRISLEKTLANYARLIRQRIPADHSAPREAESLIQRVIKADPSRNKKYSLWLLRTWLKGGVRYVEDFARANQALAVYDRFKWHLHEAQRDINRIGRLNELEDLVAPYQERKTGKEMKAEDRERTYSESEIFYDGPEGMIAIPRTKFASCFWGRGTKWCTAAGASFNFSAQYNRQGPLYVLIHPDGAKWQLHLPTHQYMNAEDTALSEEGMEASPLWRKWTEVVKLRVLSDPRSALAYAELVGPSPEVEGVIAQDAHSSLQYALGVLEGPFPAGEGAIANKTAESCEYATKVLRARFPAGEDAISQNPDCSITYALFLEQTFPQGEKAISESPVSSYYYALNILKRRFPPGEDGISKLPSLSYEYAQNIIKGRFPAGEAAIAKDPWLSLKYAQLINQRFPAGEAAIATQAATSLAYARDVLKDRFEAGEKEILRDWSSVIVCARDVVGDRWPEGEKVIVCDPERIAYYAEAVIRGRWKEMENTIAESPLASFMYAIRVINGRWKPGERAISRTFHHEDYWLDVVGIDPPDPEDYDPEHGFDHVVPEDSREMASSFD